MSECKKQSEKVEENEKIKKKIFKKKEKDLMSVCAARRFDTFRH